MTKRKIIILLLVLSFSLGEMAFAVSPRASLSPSNYSTGLTYEEAIKQKKPIVINFYVDWCAYCRRMAPVFYGLSKLYKDKYNFVIVNCDAPEYQKLTKEDFMINGYPMLYIVDPNNDNQVFLRPSFYAKPELLKKELNRYLRVHGYNN